MKACAPPLLMPNEVGLGRGAVGKGGGGGDIDILCASRCNIELSLLHSQPTSSDGRVCFSSCRMEAKAGMEARTPGGERTMAEAERARAEAEKFRTEAQTMIERAKIQAAMEGEKLKLEAERIKAEIAKAQQPQQIVTTAAPAPPPPPRETPEEKAAQMKILAETIRRENAWPWWTWLVIAGVVGGGLYLYSQKGGKRRASTAFA